MKVSAKLNEISVKSRVDPDTLMERCDEVLIKPLRGAWHEYTMPWSLENVRGLSRLDIPCISRMAVDYTYPRRRDKVPFPMDHQIQGADFLVRNPRAFLLLDMGGGKTLTSLWAFDYLLTVGAASRILILCPKSILFTAWLKEAKTHLPHLSSLVLSDDNPKKRERNATSKAPIHILNHDGPFVLEKILRKNEYSHIAYDESTAIKNKSTRRWRSVRKLLPPSRGLWEMTGTPRPGTPLDAYGQIALMRNVDSDGQRCDAHEVLGESFMSEKAWKDMTMFRAGEIWLEKEDANQTIARYMRPAFARTKRQMLKDLPPIVPADYDVGLEKDQKAAFTAMRKKDRAELSTGAIIKAANAGVRLSKLIQISCGVAYLNPTIAGMDEGYGRPTHTFSTKERDLQFLDLFEAQVGKSIVYIPFTAALHRFNEWLTKQKIRTATLTGADSAKELSDIIDAFQSNSPRSPQVLVAIPQKMSHGITATAASMTCWYAPVIRSETYQQANNRMDRPGQRNSMLLAHLFGSPTELRLYEKLQDNALTQQGLMSIYEEFLAG